jgi:hypothetical protein
MRADRGIIDALLDIARRRRTLTRPLQTKNRLRPPESGKAVYFHGLGYFYCLQIGAEA